MVNLKGRYRNAHNGLKKRLVSSAHKINYRAEDILESRSYRGRKYIRSKVFEPRGIPYLTFLLLGLKVSHCKSQIEVGCLNY